MLLSGEFHFWRTDRAAWGSSLHAIADLGIEQVSTYLSWRRHEPRRGELDLRGRHAPELDVHAFLHECDRIGLGVNLKPGPWICAEEPGGGYPDWLLGDERILARDHADRVVLGYNPPFKHPMPSYASSIYRDHVRAWIAAVWRELADELTPHGPITMTQLDNEISLGFQDSMYGFDYHDEAIAAFRRHARGHGLPDDVEPPRPTDRASAGGMPRHPTPIEQAWIAFQRAYLADYAAWLHDVNAAAGAGSLTTSINLNAHPVRGRPQNAGSITTTIADRAAPPPAILIGEDHYFVPPLDGADIAAMALAVALADVDGAVPWVPEIQSGIWRSPGEPIAYRDPTVGEIAAWWGAALALGYRGLNLYMLVDRENWALAPLAAGGTPTELAVEVASLVAATRAVPDLASFKPVPSAVLACDPEALDSAYRVTGPQANPYPPWDDPDARAAYDRAVAAAAELTRRGVHYTVTRDKDEAGSGRSGIVATIEDVNHLDPQPPIHAAQVGVLTRLHAHPDGRRVAYVVVWDESAVANGVSVHVPQTDALVDVRSATVHPVLHGHVELPDVGCGLHLFEILTSQRGVVG